MTGWHQLTHVRAARTIASPLAYDYESVAEQRMLNVSDVVKGPGFGTAPTVYARLAELENAGWIKSIPDPRDGRAKQHRQQGPAKPATRPQTRTPPRRQGRDRQQVEQNDGAFGQRAQPTGNP